MRATGISRNMVLATELKLRVSGLGFRIKGLGRFG